MDVNRKNVKDKADSRKKLVDKKKIHDKIKYFMDIVKKWFVLIITVIISVFVISVFFLCGNVKGIDTVLDFMIAALSGTLLIYSIINKRLKDDSKKDMFQTVIGPAIYTVLFVVFIFIAAVQKDGWISRAISTITLVISTIVEIKDYFIFQNGYINEGHNQRLKEIDDLNNKSIMS